MRQLTITKIVFDTNKREVNRYIFKVISLNNNGNILDETEYDSNSNLVYRNINRFSKSGRAIEHIEYDSHNELLERQSFVENEDGILIKSITEYGDGTSEIKEFALTELGNADKATITNENSELIGHETYVFDEEGNMISEIETDSDNNEISKFVKDYSEKGLLVKEEYCIDGELEHIEKFKYNDKGLVTEIIKKEADNSKIQHELIEYDINQNERKRTTRNYKDNYEMIENYEYDENNNMLLNNTYTNGQKVFENKSTYYKNNDIESEEIMEIDWAGVISSHEKLIHEYIE